MGEVPVWVSTTQSLVTTLALIVAGIWSYLLFIRQRQQFPRAEVSHRVSFFDLESNEVLVRITVAVKNVGAVLVRLVEGRVQIQQVRPTTLEFIERMATTDDLGAEDRLEFEWPTLGKMDCQWKEEPHEVEPTESDEFHFDFVISQGVRTIQVYSYFRNSKKKRYFPNVWKGREIGWNHTTIAEVDLNGQLMAGRKEDEHV